MENVIVPQFLWCQRHQRARHQRGEVSEARVHAVDGGSDVANAFRVRAMSVGVEGDVPEVH